MASKRQRGGDGNVDELRLRSRQDYLAKREAEKLALLRRQVAEEEEEERTNGNLTKTELREFARNRDTLRLAEERLNIDDRNEGYILPDADYSNKSEVLNRRHKDDKYVTEVQQWENEQSAKAKSAQIHGPKGGRVQEQDYDYVFDHAQAINWVSDSALVDPEKQALQSKLDEAEKKALSIEEARKSLPIYQFKEQILAAFAEHQILIFVAETGSGKTTQLPQYLYEYFQSIGDEGAVACSQPRRVAAMSVAQRVAEEAGTRLGDVVGYQVRFESKVSDKSKLVYMTDGLLLRMFQSNPLLEGYSAIMIDEAHERTVSTDIIMAMLKDVARFRPDLKLLISSATMDAQKFQRYFDDCPVFNVPGRTHPITTYHTPAPEANYLSASVTTVFQIHLSQGPGDILVFLTGQDEIEAAQQSLEETAKKLGSRAPPLIVAPCYSALPADEQMKIFVPTPPGSRKVVLATNIAETSLTIDGIVYVIDVGMVKEDVYNPRTGMQSLVVNPCSRAQAQQRSGRAGRTGPGKCFRLYTRHAWLSELPESTAPEILRTNLTQTVLLLKSMGINDIINFDFLDAPSPDALIQSLTFLYAIGCLNQEGKLTKLGRRIAEFPTEVTLAKAICSAEEYGCVEEILTIVAMLGESGALHLRPRNKRLEADAARKRFYSKEGGDHLALLTIYNSFAESGYDSIWARENFLQYRSLNRARNVREQLEKLCDRVEVQHSSCGASDHIAIRKALTAGFFVNAARLQRDGQSYRCVKTGITTHIHPSSGMMDAKPNLPKWVLYYELVLTSKEWIRTVMPIEAEWLVEVAPHYHKRADLDKLGVDKKMPKEKTKAAVAASLLTAAAKS